VGWRHVGEDQVGMRQDVLGASQVYPGAVHTAGRSTFREIAALDRFCPLYTRVETVGFGHEGDCNTLILLRMQPIKNTIIHLDGI
jgi:hypothetical protein